MDDSPIHPPPVSFQADRMRTAVLQNRVFSKCPDSAPPDLIDGLNSIFMREDPASAATACLGIMIADRAWSSPSTIAAWFDSLSDDRHFLSLLAIAFARTPADWDFAGFSPGWVSALLALFPDPQAVAVLSALVSHDSEALAALLAALAPAGGQWEAFVTLFHQVLPAHEESAFLLLTAVLSHRRSVACLLRLMFDFTDNFAYFGPQCRVLVLRALARFCKRDSAVSRLFAERDSADSLFAAIGGNQALLLPGLELAREVTRAYDRNLLFLRKTGLVAIITASVARMDSPAIACACRVLCAAVNTGRARAAVFLVRSGVILELNCHRNRFSFTALEAFVRLLCFCCHYGSTECVEKLLGMDAIGAIVTVGEGLEDGATRKRKCVRLGLAAIAALLEEQGRMPTEAQALFGDEGLALLNG
jgi:hypothetical protein